MFTNDLDYVECVSTTLQGAELPARLAKVRDIRHGHLATAAAAYHPFSELQARVGARLALELTLLAEVDTAAC